MYPSAGCKGKGKPVAGVEAGGDGGHLVPEGKGHKGGKKGAKGNGEKKGRMRVGYGLGVSSIQGGPTAAPQGRTQVLRLGLDKPVEGRHGHPKNDCQTAS